jgi:protein TonB
VRPPAPKPTPTKAEAAKVTPASPPPVAPVVASVAPAPARLVPPTLVGGMVGAGCVPAYPKAAQRAGIQGSVLMRAQVAADGVPAAITVIRGSGSDLLDRAAAEALRACRFQPATSGGHPVPGVTEVPYRFALEN